MTYCFGRLPITVLLALCLLGSQVQAQDKPTQTRILSVLGVGKVEAKPDYARLVVNVITRSSRLAESAGAHQRRAGQALAVINSLKQDQVEIRRSSFRVSQELAPRSPQSPDKQPETQYVALTSFILEVLTVDNLNKAISTLADAGLFEIGDVTYHVRDDSQALNEARRAAVLNAKLQATALADAAGLALKEIVEIRGAEIPANPASRFSGGSAMGGYQVQVVPPATLDFSASVEMRWRIEPR
jgi:uncharacterized protein YggE